MCARPSWQKLAGVSPASGNRQRYRAASSGEIGPSSEYRVLRVLSRDTARSVDREHAGRNASSVKVSSPVKQSRSVVAEQLCSSEGNTRRHRPLGTTGVQVHGMYVEFLSEPGRSAIGGEQRKRPPTKHPVQGLTPKSGVMSTAEVRTHHSSEEVG
jgi:hypothetical protein